MNVILGVAIVIATFAGPVAAVLVTRRIDRIRQQRDRQLEVFRLLMASRRAPLPPDRVRALNLLEIEFYGIQAVQKAYRDVMRHINLPQPLPQGWANEQQKLLTRLLTEMAKVLGYDLQQLDVLEGGYYPQGYADTKAEEQAVRQALMEVLSGRRPLLVGQSAPTPAAPFPPPPVP